jgi:hypothetical protein
MAMAVDGKGIKVEGGRCYAAILKKIARIAHLFYGLGRGRM